MHAVPPSAIALGSIFLYNCVNAIYAYSINIMNISMFQLLAIQTIPCFFACSAYTIISGTPHGLLAPPGTRKAIWSMAALSIASNIPILFTLNQLTLSEHVTVMCTLPFATAFMGWIWLRERFTRTQAICCVFCILGVMLVTDPFRIRGSNSRSNGKDGIPDTLSGKLVGVGLSLLGVMLRAPHLVLVRKIGDRATTIQIMTITYGSLATASPLLMLITRAPIVFPSQTLVWSLMGALIVISLTAEAALVYAGQRISPTTIAICSYSGVLFSNIIQWLLYGNHPSLVASTGMLIVSTAGLYGIIYGPIDVHEESESAQVQSETSRLL